MKKIKIFFAAFMVLLTIIFAPEKAFAEVKAFLVLDKETGITYNYSSKALQKDLINSVLGLDAPLWKEFNEKSSINKINAIYHDSGKFVPYNQVEEAYIKNTLENKDFDLDSFVEEEASEAEGIPAEFASFIGEKERVVAILKDDVLLKGEESSKLVIEGDLYIAGNNASIKNIIVKGSLIISPGTKGKAIIEGVAAEKIEVLSGEENGVKFSNVEAKVLKVKDDLKNPVIGMETSKIQDTNYNPGNKPGNSEENGGNNPGNNSGNNPDPVEDDSIKVSVSKTNRNEKEINLTINITNISGQSLTVAIYEKATGKLCYLDQTTQGSILNKSYRFTTVLDKSNYEAVIKDSTGKNVKINF